MEAVAFLSDAFDELPFLLVKGEVCFEVVDEVDFDESGIGSSDEHELVLHELLDLADSDILGNSFEHETILGGAEPVGVDPVGVVLHAYFEVGDEEDVDEDGREVYDSFHLQRIQHLHVHDVDY